MLWEIVSTVRDFTVSYIFHKYLTQFISINQVLEGIFVNKPNKSKNA